jgi:hypothetical protein
MDDALTKELLGAVKSGLHAAIKDKLAGYNSPLEKLMANVVEQHAPELRALLVESISTAISDDGFRQAIRDGLRSKLGKILVERFGGELEKQVNLLKSDPVTRARITVAIEEIISKK